MPVLRLEDGAELAYADEGGGQPILLVHGWAAHAGFFDGLRVRLSRTHRVIAPTLRGHARADIGWKPLSIETLGEDLVELVETLDLNTIAAIGWSMGAMALWAAAPRIGKRLDALIVEEMGPKLVNESDWRFGLAGAYRPEDVAATLSELRADWPAYVARFAPRMFAPETRSAQPELIQWATREMAKCDRDAMAALWGSMTRQDFRTALRAIDAPVLVVRGAESQVHPDGATAFVAAACPRGSRVTIAGAGHVPHLEAPDQFFDHVEAFARNPRRRDAIKEGVRP